MEPQDIPTAVRFVDSGVYQFSINILYNPEGGQAPAST